LAVILSDAKDRVHARDALFLVVRRTLLVEILRRSALQNDDHSKSGRSPRTILNLARKKQILAALRDDTLRDGEHSGETELRRLRSGAVRARTQPGFGFFCLCAVWRRTLLQKPETLATG
jgi:hypothetical protein